MNFGHFNLFSEQVSIMYITLQNICVLKLSRIELKHPKSSEIKTKERKSKQNLKILSD